MTRRATAATAAVALALLLLASCQASGGGPKAGDVLPEAELSYPGAEEMARSFRDEERARSVDGPDLSRTARLTRRLRLSEGVARSTLLDWYQERLLAAG